MCLFIGRNEKGSRGIFKTFLGGTMSTLTAYGYEITNVFQLMGMLENDITKSIAWGMVNSPKFLNRIINELISKIPGMNSNLRINSKEVLFLFQEYEKNYGITDLEITDNKNFYFIIEAKKGLNLPEINQLSLYSQRGKINKSQVKHKAIFSMSACSDQFAGIFLLKNNAQNINIQVDYTNKTINNITVRHLPWKTIYEIADSAKKDSALNEKKLLEELIEYIGGLMKMQSRESNWVYIVSLSNDSAFGTEITWMDVVEKYNRYFHPLGTGGWPKEPINYIAFRYNGKLQSIHYIDDYVISDNLNNQIPNMPNQTLNSPYLVYTLGPAIIRKNVKTGNIVRATRRWAMLDALLTEDTIYDACELSNKRAGLPNNYNPLNTPNPQDIEITVLR
jgi:hypothetical protein